MYNSVQTTIDYVENEMRFCEVFPYKLFTQFPFPLQRSNREALVEVELGRALLARNANRTRRAAANYGGYGARGTNPSYGSESDGGGGTPVASSGGEEGGYGNDVNVQPNNFDSTGSPIESECPGCWWVCWGIRGG